MESREIKTGIVEIVSTKPEDDNNERGEKKLTQIAPVNLHEQNSIPTEIIMQKNVF